MSRFLRIAAAVVFALLGVALVALWVRSYYWMDGISGPFAEYLAGCTSNRGVIALALSYTSSPESLAWTVDGYAVSETPELGSWEDRTILGFGIIPRDSFGPAGLYLPHCFFAASSFALAALFAFKRIWRFSVRSVLVATTILAALLGLAVYIV